MASYIIVRIANYDSHFEIQTSSFLISFISYRTHSELRLVFWARPLIASNISSYLIVRIANYDSKNIMYTIPTSTPIASYLIVRIANYDMPDCSCHHGQPATSYLIVRIANYDFSNIFFHKGRLLNSSSYLIVRIANYDYMLGNFNKVSRIFFISYRTHSELRPVRSRRYGQSNVSLHILS